MTALASMLRWDIRLQWRYGLYYAAIFMSIIWVLVLRPLPGDVKQLLLPVVLFGDLALIGFFFMAGLMFFEKAEKVLQGLVVSPLSVWHYLVSKSLALTLVTLVSVVIVVFGAFGPSVNWPLLIAGTTVTSLLLTMVGFSSAARFGAINEFLIPSFIPLMIMSVPLLPYFGVGDSPLFNLAPTQGPLLLLKWSFGSPSSAQVGLALAGSLVWIAAAYAWARWTFERAIARAGGSAEAQALRSAAGPGNGSGAARTRTLPDPATTRRRGPIVALLQNDLRNIQRDSTLLFFVAYPIILAVIVRWLVPVLTARFADQFDLSQWYDLLVSFFAVLALPDLFGAVIGLLLLDERDDRTLQALHVSPLPMLRYLAYRLALPTLLSLVFCFIVVWVTGLVQVSIVGLLPIALMGALEAPMYALALASVAGNKVEGLAVIKGMGVFMMFPLVAYFLAPPWQWLMGLSPTYWPAKAFWMLADGQSGVWLYLIIGAVYHVLLLTWLARRFRVKL